MKYEEETVELTCPKCGYGFTGWARDVGSVCFDCYACKRLEEEDK